jgi:hypothetical protein
MHFRKRGSANMEVVANASLDRRYSGNGRPETIPCFTKVPKDLENCCRGEKR